MTRQTIIKKLLALPPHSTWFVTKHDWHQAFPNLTPRQYLHDFKHILYKKGLTGRQYGSKAHDDSYLLVRWDRCD